MIIERIDRAGHIIETFHVKRHHIAVGRGYGNDVIIHDPYVDAGHIEIDFDLLRAEFYVSDLQTKNGTQVVQNGKTIKLGKQKTKLNAGDEIYIGKTRLRVMHGFVDVPSAMPLSRFEYMYRAIDNWVFFIFAFVTLVALYTFDQYLNAPYSEKLSKELITGAFVSFVALGYASLWVLVAKIQHHEGHFFLHVNLALLAIIGLWVFDFIEPILRFNLEWLLLGGFLSNIFSAVVLFCVVIISASQFNRISKPVRYSIASVLPLIILLMAISELIDRPEYQTAPEYLSKIVSPKLQWKSAMQEEDFLIQAEQVYTDH